ncbi:MAG: tRNA (adenosine(37)-N6)-threonylcarbamoyltransferase complex dimerization subunit type 1 TsaB [Gemmatimonadota bacterium]|nr:tRNA (adenosine(37)-N6)-threonylcarbamoyltransferase complex dimerization subunit type 1 TsaB [Gemmatimonadota bacterium]
MRKSGDPLFVALETSTRLGSVAVGDGSDVLAESILSVRATYSETVLDEVSRLLDRVGARVSGLDGVVVGSGPGSFTGVRIAAALAKGLCFAHDIPLFAYSSLRALAASVGVAPVCGVFDARRDEVYAAAFPAGGGEGPSLGPEVLPLDDLLDRLEPVGTWSFAGDGAVAHEEAIAARGGRVLSPHLSVPRASALLWLAETAPEEGRVEDRGAWEPEYVRASGAERGVGTAAIAGPGEG